MKFSTLAAAAALVLAGLSAPALAAPTAGATVYGPAGTAVGTIESVASDHAVLNTGSVKAALPLDAFVDGEKGPTVGWERAEFEAAVNQANAEKAAALAAALVAGAELVSSDGVALGSVTTVDDTDMVVVELETGPVSLPKDQFAFQNERLTFLATAADLKAAVAAQAGGGD